MIQRIQSLYLLLTSVLSVLFLSGNFLSFINDSGAEIIMNYRGLWMQGPVEATLIRESQLIILIIGLLLIILPLIAIFLYRNRQQQLKLAAASFDIISSICHHCCMVCIFKCTNPSGGTFSGVQDFPSSDDAFVKYTGWHGIRKDEKLVRSYDRLKVTGPVAL